jgi:16S rRNA (cytosine967-C5)-methyltransferase
MNDEIKFVGRRHTARSLALQVLLDCARREGFVQEVLDRRLAAEPAMSGPDRRLTTHLAYGVLRRRGTLLAMLAPLVNRPLEQVDAWLVDALCLGAYQLAMLTQIPPHAALNETVELATAFGQIYAKGFLNGVLRSFASLITDDRVLSPGADCLPMEDGAYRGLTRRVFPDPARQPVEYLSRAFSLPAWLARRWWDRYPPEECHRLGFWFAGPAPLTLRVNPLKTTREQLLSLIPGSQPGEHPQSIRLRDHAAVRELPGYADGWFAVQDESAMRVGSAVSPQPGWSVLDLCAAPGGKSTHLAELMNNQGRVVACDVDDERLTTVQQLAARLNLSIVETVKTDPYRPETVPEGPFDAVLADVPCSNTGVMGRRPELRWRLSPADVSELVALQGRLLRRAISRVKPGGVVVYSTCSIEPEENGELVRAVIQETPGLTLEAEEASVPGRPADGGYWARARKR